MRQRSAQPSSCRRRSDLFRSAVQHGDGCRRRFSIRQTRSPKQARSFWCLFLKKARPICAAHLARATRDSFPRPSPHAARASFPHPSSMPSTMLFPAICSPRFYSPYSRFLYPPFAPYHIQTKRPRTPACRQIVHIHRRHRFTLPQPSQRRTAILRAPASHQTIRA